MGVTLHFRGRLKEPNLVNELRDEVEDICVSHGWRYELFTDDKFYAPTKENKIEHLRRRIEREEENDEDNDANNDDLLPDIGLRGIMFYPHPECEPVGMLFNKNGMLSSIFNALFPEMYGRKLPWSFTKTQGVGSEIHIQIGNLLQYLGKKYFKKFNLEDDGGYFPNKDQATLDMRMGKVNSAISAIEEILAHSNFMGSHDEVIEQIQDAISRSIKDIEIQVVKIDPNELLNKEDNNHSEDGEEPKTPRRRRKP